MTVVKSRIATVANATVTAQLLSRTNWTTDHSEWVTRVTATTDGSGNWQMELLPQSTFEDETSVWLIRHPYGQHLCVVPDTGPVWLDDIEITDRGEPSEETASLYIPKSQLGQPGGPATLGLDGKVTPSQLPAGGGGTIPDATALTKGLVRLAGDLAGNADAPTVPALAGKYEKPVGGIPATDLTSAVQTSLSAADLSASQVEFDDLSDDVTALTTTVGLKADMNYVTSALSDKAAQMKVVQRYITSGDVELPDTSGAWAPLSGFEISVPAEPGDWISLSIRAMRRAESSALVDIGIKVGGSIVRYFASGTGTPAVEGTPAWYPDTIFIPQSGPLGLFVEAGDIDNNMVKFVVVHKSTGSSNGDFFASTNFPFYWCASNYGPVIYL